MAPVEWVVGTQFRAGGSEAQVTARTCDWRLSSGRGAVLRGLSPYPVGPMLTPG